MQSFGPARRAVFASVMILAAASEIATAQSVLRVLIDGNVRTIDPVVTTESMAIQHGYMIYDNLFALDGQSRPQPQMIDRFDVSADRLTWRFTLREGLKFHDGQSVAAKDVIASIKRWGARKPSGQALMQHVEGIHALDAKSFELKLKRAFGPVLEAFADPLNALFIMREADASSDPFTPLTTAIGSGPFRFVAEGWKPGDKAVYLRNAEYVARSEAPSGLAGARRALVEKVEYLHIPDATTAVQALIAGEVDMLTFPQLQLVPVLARTPNVTVKVTNPIGEQGILRTNHLVPPFDNPKARQALLYLVGNQIDYLAAIVRQADLQKPCWAVFGCGMPLESKTGIGDWAAAANIERAKALFREAGYDGRPIIIIDPPSNDRLHAMSLVTAQKLRQAGITVDVQAMDLGAWASRRNVKNDPKTDPNGWHIFHTHGKMASQGDPMSNSAAVSTCDQKNWVGWPCDEDLTKRMNDYVATAPDKRGEWIAGYQSRFFEVLPYVPLGQFLLPLAYRSNLSGVLDGPGYPVMWNIEKK